MIIRSDGAQHFVREPQPRDVTSKVKPTYLVMMAVVVAFLLGVGCSVIGKSAPSGRSKRAGYSGWVTDQDGKPIAKARVEVNGMETFTQNNGAFHLPVPSTSRYILNLSHPDFADFSHISRTPLSGQIWPLVRAQIQTVDAQQPITLTDQRQELRRRKIGGAEFKLPANALVDRHGNPPSGKVRAAIATLDVSNGEGPGDWGVRSDDGTRDGYLISYGAVFIQFTNLNGIERYQLRNGASGQLSLPVIPSMRRIAPDTPRARFWYFDTKDGYWKHTGDATFDRNARAYGGKITHLSTINTDIAKFDNAACMKITLDPSVPVGSKLRLRYHSGGTAFGQTPMFVMNDTVNAAYRLPANTNLLLELLNASDEVYGNLVVEDPAGTPLINTVVNTGAAMSSSNLWPPPPFTECKPIVLKLGTPEVEIQINELPSSDGLKDNPTDDYITWAPTFCRARLTTPMPSPVNVVLTNDPPGRIPDSGDVLFAANQDPWPVNTTAASETITVSLPGNGAWVPFVIAGKHLAPSCNDKDTIIEAHQDTAGGTVLGTKALMVRVRKNANTLKEAERNRFLFALRAFRNQGGVNYVQFQEMHRLATTAGDEAHMQPSFLPWHRAMLVHVERELQKIDPTVALHYWNWDAPAPNVFHRDFIGEHGTDATLNEPIFAASNPLNGWPTDLPFSSGRLWRNQDDHTAAPGDMTPLDLPDPVDDDLLRWTDFGPTSANPGSINSFSDDVERTSHNPGHGWPCDFGHLTTRTRSAADPLFYLLHSQIERQWAYWQRVHQRFGVVSGGALTFPSPAHYDNNGNWNTPGNVADALFRQKGAFLLDGLWPWDGTTGGTSNTAEWRPPNQATGAPTGDTPNSTPLIPSTPFPASVRRNLWPAAPAVPQNAHMIDYLGKFRPQDGLGFCYDDVKYQEN